MPNKKEIIDVLRFVDEERNKGVSVDAELVYKEFDKTLVKKVLHWGFIEFSGTDYYLTEKGYNALNAGKISKNTHRLNEIMERFNEASEKSNRKMISLTFWNLLLFFVTIIISISALVVSYNVAYGNPKLFWEYDIAGNNNMFLYYNNTIMLEFIVKNDGFSSTVYNIEPILDCTNSNCSVTISFDGEEPFEEISKPKIKSIGAKSAQFVMIIIKDIPPSDVGQEFEVLVRDFLSNEHRYIKFQRADDNLTDLFIRTLYNLHNQEPENA